MGVPRPHRNRRGLLRVWTTVGTAAVGLLALSAGCGSDSADEAPSACIRSSDSYLAALGAAPGPVRLDGEVSISSCLIPDQEGGELANVGEQMIITASRLNSSARRDPGGSAALELGYLMGAVTSGADSIHTDLVRRLNAAAQFSESGEALPPEFQREFGRGYSAALESG